MPFKLFQRLLKSKKPPRKKDKISSSNKAIELIKQLLKLNNNKEFSQWINEHISELDDNFFQALESTIAQASNENPQTAKYLEQFLPVLRNAASQSPDATSSTLPPSVTQLLKDLQSGNIDQAEALKRAETIKLSNEEVNANVGYLEHLSQQKPLPQLALFLADIFFIAADTVKNKKLEGILLGTCACIFRKNFQAMPRAIEAYIKALEIFDSLGDKQRIGTTQNNLGLSYYDLPAGDRGENLKNAIEYYQKALEIRTKADSPVDYAMTQNNLGSAYCDLPAGNRGKNLKEAIECYQKALEVCTKADSPVIYAGTQNNLGNAYYDLPTGDRGKNLKKAIECYQQSLEIYTKGNFPVDYAMTWNNLGNAYWNLPIGDRGENLKKAIECYQHAKEIYTKTNFPVQYAATQNNLGNAYCNLPTGDRGENLKNAIEYYQKALEIRTKADSPVDYAMTQNNLGVAFFDLPTGNRGKNLQNAIACYQKALEIRTKADSPVDYAMTQNNLGNAYCNLPTGDRGKNLQNAIACYQKALEIRTKADFPVDYAMTQNNLGAAYFNLLPTGDRGENLQNAIACYQKALEITTKADFPINYAMTQNNLGNAYLYLPTGDQGKNLQNAIECYQLAMEIYTKVDFPVQYATAQNNMGSAYRSIPTGDWGKNLQNAIACHQQALDIFTKVDFPVNYATTQNNQGNAYLYLPTGDRKENLQNAIECYKQALEIFTKVDFPVLYATTQNNMGLAYGNLPTGNRGENLKNAISCYQEALKIRKQQKLWEDILQTSKNLIQLYFVEKDWEKVLDISLDAIGIYDEYWDLIFLSESKKVLSNLVFDIFRMLSYALFKKRQFLEAVSYLDEGSSRHLSEVLRMGQELPEGIPEHLKKRILSLYKEIQNLRPGSGKMNHVETYKEKLQEFKELMKPYRPEETITLRDFLLQLKQEKAALLYLNVTSHGGFYALVHDTDSGEKDMFLLDKIGDDIVKEFYWNEKDGWFTLYNQDRLNKLGKLFEQAEGKIQDFANQSEFNKILQRIEELEIKRLVILPQGILHTFPFGGIKEIPEDLEICFVPNAQLLLNSYQSTRVTDRNQMSFTGFANPCEDTKLFFTNAEVAYISSLMHSKENKNAKIYWGRKGNKQAISDDGQESILLHFSTHGFWDTKEVENSCLFLFQDGLHLKDIYQLRFPSCLMVGMSACETGIPDINSPAEYASLSAAFHTAGAKVVVSTLWPVLDLSTSLLMGEFYRCFLHDRLSPAYAMRQAQKWLKKSPPGVIIDRLKEYRVVLKVEKEKLLTLDKPWADSQINMINRSLIAIEFQINKIREANIPPFQNPYYWAGFVVNGWGF